MLFRHTNGGWNKSHGQIEETPRIDSFELARMQGYRSITCGKDRIDFFYVPGDDMCELFPDDLPPVEIGLSVKPNGYGGEQLFFVCPACGRRFRFLYQTGSIFLCRKCVRLNYRSQQETRSDCMYYYHKGMRLVEARLPVWTQFRPDGFMFCKYLPDRPYYMHTSTYHRYLERFLRYRKKHEERQMEDIRRLLKNPRM